MGERCGGKEKIALNYIDTAAREPCGNVLLLLYNPLEV